jgi:hypothetical protein
MFLAALLSLQSVSTLGDLNVYDKPMTNCGPDHALGCTYAAFDAGAHEVCVTQLPHGFSSETGQGPWSDQFTGQPWCICIWAYSNYILQNKDLPLKCESIPSKVLEEPYSLDKFKQCGSMSSTAGCGAEDIRRSIQSLCQQCDTQATDAASKTALKTKCDAVLASAPAAPLQRLYEETSPTKGVSQLQGMVGMSPITLGIFGFLVAGFSMGMVLHTFRSAGHTIYQQDGEDKQDGEYTLAQQVDADTCESLHA